jgi:hypothetical protein
MELDDDEWKLRDKLLLVEVVKGGNVIASASNGTGNRDTGDHKRDGSAVNWAAVSRLLRKHIPQKRLTSPASFGSRVRATLAIRGGGHNSLINTLYPFQSFFSLS